MKDTEFWSVIRWKRRHWKKWLHFLVTRTMAVASFSMVKWRSSFTFRVLKKNHTGLFSCFKEADIAVSEASVSIVNDLLSSITPRVISVKVFFKFLNAFTASSAKRNCFALTEVLSYQSILVSNARNRRTCRRLVEEILNHQEMEFLIGLIRSGSGLSVLFVIIHPNKWTQVAEKIHLFLLKVKLYFSTTSRNLCKFCRVLLEFFPKNDII